jgi:hypothetical protein
MRYVKRKAVAFRFFLSIWLVFGATGLNFSIGLASENCRNSQIFAYDFDSDWEGWSADNGVWEVGSPGDPGPPAAHSGSDCAATVLRDFYPNTSSRLVSPLVQLPLLGKGEELRLWFWQWTKFARNDSGQVQLSYEEAPGVWSPWETLGGGYTASSGVWSLAMVDLSSYAGEKVRVAFNLQQGAFSFVDAGWYIDDVLICAAKPLFRQPEEFDSGWGGWHSDNEVWEVGSPGAPGPPAAHSGSGCAATVLKGFYPNTSSRLISPSVQLPLLGEGEELRLWFWQWAKFARNDSGEVQLSYEEAPGVWSPWENLVGGHTASSGVWSLAMVDLSSYAGEKVRVAFNLQQGAFSFVDAGWYIDEVYIEGPCIDNDGDGYGQFISDFCTYTQTDCDDADPQVNPGQAEVPRNRIDDNCNGKIDEGGWVIPWLQLLLDR